MMDKLGERVSAFSFDDLSEPARERLLLCLLANISVAVAGVKYCVLPEPAAGSAIRLFSGRKTASARDAAFWNAGVMHARTQDDFHPVGNLHIGTIILPALLAVADEKPMSGKEFLSALGAGYMIGVGLSRSFSPITTPRGLRSTCIYGPFGAAATVARARRLDASCTASALAMATAYAGGTTQAWLDGSDEWQLHPAAGAEAGIKVCGLAQAGVKGGNHALDGVSGFYNAYTGQRPKLEDLLKDSDPSAAIVENVIKRYPVSGICQAVVLASEQAASNLPANADIRGILVEMNSFEMRYPGTLNRGPFKSFGDKLMSAAFCSASVIARRGFSFEDFHRKPDNDLVALIEKVKVVDDPGLPLLSARVSIEFADGRKLVEEVKNSRDEVAIDWASIDPWAASLWEEGGRSAKDYGACRDAVRALPGATIAQLPM